MCPKTDFSTSYMLYDSFVRDARLTHPLKLYDLISLVFTQNSLIIHFLSHRESPASW